MCRGIVCKSNIFNEQFTIILWGTIRRAALRFARKGNPVDLTVFAEMDADDLRNCLQFLLWHYRVMDSFWYIYISEFLDEATADCLNESLKSLVPVAGTNGRHFLIQGL